MSSSFARNAIVLGLLVGRRSFRDRHVPAGAADDHRRSRHRYRRDADEPDVLLRRRWRSSRSSTARWSDIAGRKPPLYFGLGLFTVALDRLRAGAEHRVADRVPFRAGDRRLRRDDHPAGRRSRPPYRGRCDAPDVADHAGLQRFADPRAALRQRAHRLLRLACGVRRDLHRRHPRRRPRRHLPPGDAAAGGSDQGELRQRLRRLPASPRRPPLPRADLHRRPRHGELLRFPRDLVLRLYRPLRPDPDAVQPRLLDQRRRLHRLGPVRARLLAARFGLPQRGQARRLDLRSPCRSSCSG